MKTPNISVSELKTRDTLRKQGKLSRHFETYNQYLIRLEFLPKETNPI